MPRFTNFQTNFVKGLIPLLTLLLSLCFTTCDTPMGMGDPIDWEPPVLTLSPKPDNPFYVRLGATLSGTVTDNVAVDRVILREAGTNKELGRASIDGKNWTITFNFTKEQNGQTIPAEIVAFDKMGNSGDKSVAAVTLIIDIQEPIVEDIWIQRTVTKMAYLGGFNELYDLERTDQYGTARANANTYQNGWFEIVGKVKESETRIDIIDLKLYDYDPDTKKETLVYTRPLTGDSSAYSPRWLVKEEEIIEDGKKIFGQYYYDRYYNSPNKRYYYRVEITAIDRSKNESVTADIVQIAGYLCMWYNADEPKGILDPTQPTIIGKGQPLPVEFFDDDTLDKTYAGLLTLEQWEGTVPIGSGINLSTYTTNEAKLNFLKTTLEGGGTIYNWRYPDKAANPTSEPIVNLKEDIDADFLNHYVQTGNSDSDYGDYILFTIVSDEKLEPHDPLHATSTPKSMARFWSITIQDENQPVIVFDTVDTKDAGYQQSQHTGGPDKEPIKAAQTGDSPEENTFPKLTDGRYFEINGYTQRLNKNDGAQTRVTKFRIAWIPYGMPGGADSYVSDVRQALKEYPYSTFPEGVTYWDFTPFDSPDNDASYQEGKLVNGTGEQAGNGFNFTKQVFRKKFDILGGSAAANVTLANYQNPDDTITLINDPSTVNEPNFIYQNKLENETKLFVIYAEDELGHDVYRQLRILGNKALPNLTVYDVSGKLRLDELPVGYPNSGESPWFGTPDASYYTALNNYNNSNVYNVIKGKSTGLTTADETVPFYMYSRETFLKYWVIAERSGDLAIDNIKMTDITYENSTHGVGHYDGFDRALSFVEYYPDETQRVFLFEATDTLGNTARIQRTVSITNAARLESITTNEQNGTYGINKVITLSAEFSGAIRIEGGTPELNIRYMLNGTTVYRALPCVETSTNSLVFKFTVPEGATGVLETLYAGISGISDAQENRPISLPGSTRIIDVGRSQDAFVPGYSSGNATMPNWTSNKGSLQEPLVGKTISLDGIRPQITKVLVTGKSPRQGGNEYYFKKDETINFTITANENVMPSTTTPYLRYSIRNVSGSTEGPYTSAFKYVRPSGSNVLVFSLPINDILSQPDGELINVTLYGDGYNSATGAGTIQDEVGNWIESSLDNLLDKITEANTRIFIKKAAPNAPAPTLNGTGVNDVLLSAAANIYNVNLTMNIPASNAQVVGGAGSPRYWENVIQYSIDGGQSWTPSTIPINNNVPTAVNAVPLDGNGINIIKVRYVDWAGNEGAQAEKTININGVFPKLLAINPVQSNGWYRKGSTLAFKLEFDNPVRIAAYSNVSITLTNRQAAPYASERTYPLSAVSNISTYNSTVTLTWSNITGYEMRDGLFISGVILTGLRDEFNNQGSTGTATYTADVTIAAATGTPAAYTVTNLAAGLKVDAIDPTVDTYSPANGGTSNYPAGSDKRNVITLTFKEPVMKGMGTITIRPQKDFFIPPVFENNGYYVDQFSTSGEDRYDTSSSSRTWVAGFYDIYNSIPAATLRNYLTESTTEASQSTSPSSGIPSSVLDTGNPSMSRLRLDPRTGQAVGPYVKTTHGLKEGYGYSGNYSGGSNPASGNASNFYRYGPNTDGSSWTIPSDSNNIAENKDPFPALIPDTSTKWVLAYPYSISNADNINLSDSNVSSTINPDKNQVVGHIRTALNAAKFRWQEIDVSNVVVSDNGLGTTVTITLNEPLLKGLRWQLSYPEGTFTDEAGNPAPTLAADSDTYTFWSPDVQKPVIRVDRKSFDARTANWHTPTGTTTADYTYAVPGNSTGWGIDDFNSIAYRIETETPDATIFYKVTDLKNSTTSNAGPFNAVTADWTGNIPWSGGNVAGDFAWGDTTQFPTPLPRSFWVRPNLIRRSGASGTEFTGTGDPPDTIVRFVNYVNGNMRQSSGYLQMFRSYNRDAKLSDFARGSLSSTGNNNSRHRSSISFGSLVAGKSYVYAVASKDNGASNTTALMGYEGVFRTVIVLNNIKTTTRNGNAAGAAGVTDSIGKVIVKGSNITSATPSVPGFPVRDGAQTGDSRFVKMMYRQNANNRFYWVSTEIVSEWYFIYFGNGGSEMRTGEMNNYMTVGYGDLTYGNNNDHRNAAGNDN